jgi:hypothetical protein
MGPITVGPSPLTANRHQPSRPTIEFFGRRSLRHDQNAAIVTLPARFGNPSQLLLDLIDFIGLIDHVFQLKVEGRANQCGDDVRLPAAGIVQFHPSTDGLLGTAGAEFRAYGHQVAGKRLQDGSRRFDGCVPAPRAQHLVQLSQAGKQQRFTPRDHRMPDRPFAALIHDLAHRPPITDRLPTRMGRVAIPAPQIAARQADEHTGRAGQPTFALSAGIHF